MILVDTSVWVDHLRNKNRELADLLEEGAVASHPLVVGELACGSIRNRMEVLELLHALPEASVADHDEALTLVSNRRLHGKGLGWIDVHLLASALLSGCPLWTLDKPLQEAAARLKVSV